MGGIKIKRNKSSLKAYKDGALLGSISKRTGKFIGNTNSIVILNNAYNGELRRLKVELAQLFSKYNRSFDYSYGSFLTMNFKEYLETYGYLYIPNNISSYENIIREIKEHEA